MIPVRQTIRGDKGNCFAACLASILEMPIEEMPADYLDADKVENWMQVWQEFLRPLGLGLVWTGNCLSAHTQSGYAIRVFQAGDDADNEKHAVVTLNGEIVHDPLDHLDNGIGRAKLVKTLEWYFLTVLDPAQSRAQLREAS